MSSYAQVIPQLAEAARLGAFIEITTSNVYRNDAGRTAGAALIRKIGAEHIIISTDCGQTGNVYPTDCLVRARVLSPLDALFAGRVAAGASDRRSELRCARAAGHAREQDGQPDAEQVAEWRT